MTKLQTKSHKILAKKKYFELLSYPWKFSFLCKNDRFSNIYSLLQLHDLTTKKISVRFRNIGISQKLFISNRCNFHTGRKF